MNKPIIYVPFSFLVIVSLVHISLSIPSFSLIIHFPRFLICSVILGLITGAIVYSVYRTRFDFDNLYKITASSVLFSFILWLAFITFFNGWYTTKTCVTSSYEVTGYVGRYTSGLGVTKKEELKENQWILSIIKEGKKERFVFDEDISTDNRVTKTMDLEFCKGLLGTEMLKLPQMED